MQYSFNNSRKIPKLAQFIPEIYNNFYYKILRYFWGVTLWVILEVGDSGALLATFHVRPLLVDHILAG